MRKRRGSVVRKSIAGIIVPLVFLAVVVCFVGYRCLTEAMSMLYERGAVEIAVSALSGVDADRMDAYAASNGTSEEYIEVLENMEDLCNSSGATFIYVIQPDLSDYNHITFIFSTINKDSKYTRYDFGYYRETTNDDYKVKYRRLYEGQSESEIVVRDRGYIETDAHITAMVPVKDSNGTVRAILCVQRQMDIISAVRKTFVWIVIGILLVLEVIIIIGQHFYLRKVLINPLKLITTEAERFATQEVSVGRRLDEQVKNNDEIGVLASSIDQMEDHIVEYVGNLTKATAEKERISTELSLAQRIQADMLPNIYPAFPDRPEFDIFASMEPAKEVGGDFYDFFFVDSDHLCMMIADVSGKGVPAALFMMASRIILANNAMMGKNPARILAETNAAICSNNREEMFVTVWLGILEISTGHLVASNAGHEYPVIKKADGRFELFKDRHGFVIGGLETARYKDYELTLEPGSKLFLYTDGVPEATDDKDEQFGNDRMIDALNSDPDADPEHILANMRKAVNKFVNGAEQFDDLTMMCFEYKGPNAKA
ncbi:MAG: SpoIIE family protein phosphatase [Sphaerochaetaceae bacterium]|nr:SpoIIE family protein phosphatase [Sphaerochaetaceae bacterium]